jgi:CubicO group peptidase (beta-lactamase class C family)
VTYLEAAGVDPTTKTPLRKDTVIWVASMTKPIVTAAVLMLQDEGKLKIGDPVSKFVPEFRAPAMVRVLKPGSPPVPPFNPAVPPDPKAPKPQYDLVPAKRPITLQDLLTHTSGLQTIGIPNDAIPPITEGATLASWVPQLSKAPLDFQPGTQWAYSNATGFDVLAYVVEVVSGQSFDKFVAARIFKPIGMRDASFGPQANLADRTMKLPPMFASFPCLTGKTFFCGSAGLWMTADDYWRFAQMLLDKGSVNGKQLLRAETVALMTSNHAGNLFPGQSGIPSQGVGFGLSVATVLDAKAAGLAVPTGSFGWDGVGTRRFWVMPATRTVVVMMIPGGTAPPVHRDVERAVAAATE